MPNSEIGDKELKVLIEIGKNGSEITQRDLSSKTGFSLGLINIILKRLVSKGLIKLRGLNQKKIEYILTPKGFTEKVKKSYSYLLRTINSFMAVKKKVEEIILRAYARGFRKFFILGDSELSNIVEIVFKDLKMVDADYYRAKTIEEVSSDAFILATENMKLKNNNKNLINLSEELLGVI